MPIEPRLDVVAWVQILPALGDSTSAKEQTYSFQAGPWKELQEVWGLGKRADVHLRTSPTLSLLWDPPLLVDSLQSSVKAGRGGSRSTRILRSLEGAERNKVWALGGL